MGAADAHPFAGATVLGIRPEYVALGAPQQPGTVSAVVTQAQDIGTYWLVSARVDGMEAPVRARIPHGHAVPAPGATVWLVLVGPHTCFYKDDRLLARDARDADAARAVQEVSPT
jgi:glycerol transport system ATP-binding protein